MINKIFILLLLIFSSCNTKLNEEIKIEILSKELKAYCKDDECLSEYIQGDNRYNDLSRSVFRISIKNTSKTNYLINTNNILHGYPGYSSSIEGKNLDLIFLKIVDKDDLSICEINQYTGVKISNMPEECYVKDNQSLIDLNNLGYKVDEYWVADNNRAFNNLIFLKKGEIKYFEFYVYLPLNKVPYVVQNVELLKSKHYDVYYKLVSDTTDLKKYLIWSQLKNIKDNNYKLYHGTIESINSIPIVFIDDN